MAKDKDKHLIPCFKGIDAYDMPKEFARLQAQNLGKVGAIQDLLRGIEKILPKNQPVAVATPAESVAGVDAGNLLGHLLNRGNMALVDDDWEKAQSVFEEVLDNDPQNVQAYLGKTMAQEHCRSLDALFQKQYAFYRKVQSETLSIPQNTLHIDEMVQSCAIPNYFEENTIRDLYDFDLSYSSCARNLEVQCRAAEHFWAEHSMLLQNDDIAQKKNALITDLRTEVEHACAADAETQTQIQQRYAAFLSEVDAQVTKKYQDLLAQRESDYHQWAEAAKRKNSIQQWNKLAQSFDLLCGYAESASLAEYCRIRIKKIKHNRMLFTAVSCVIVVVALIVLNIYKLNIKYIYATELMEAGKYEEAMAVFETLDGYKDSLVQIEACEIGILDEHYDTAISLLESGNVVEAYEMLVKLDGYKDSIEKAGSVFSEYKIEKLKTAQVGDYVFFGTYEQDNNTSNGKEDIAWLVLDVKDGKALLISKYALDCKQYHTSNTDITWETCTLRKWLNNDFMNAAFSAVEITMIPAVTVSADKNPEYSTNPGNATQEKVFLMSIKEVDYYFASGSVRQCEPTAYAVANGASSTDSSCWWWLRSPGHNQVCAAYVNIYGGFNKYGGSVLGSYIAVRPALWIDLGKLD